MQKETVLDMTCCQLCPRVCGVNRTVSADGFCKSGSTMRVARAALHHWEEPVLSGTRGSGTVFFTGCSLRCAYCQNHEISRHSQSGAGVTPQRLSQLFFSLIEQGAHNINLVNPTHFVPGIREALLLKKLPVPVVYNSSGYERTETLKTLAGLVDVYLPDYKYADNALAVSFSAAAHYREYAEAAIQEMLRQTGRPIQSGGMLVRGTMIRHLILPLHTENAIAVLKRVHALFPDALVSLMAQYTPCGKCEEFPELNRKITRRELDKVARVLYELELSGFVQERTSGSASYIPDFHSFTG